MVDCSQEMNKLIRFCLFCNAFEDGPIDHNYSILCDAESIDALHTIEKMRRSR